MYRICAWIASAALGLGSVVHGGSPMSYEFTYQGLLRQGGVPASGTFHLRFQLWDAPAGGVQIGGDVDEPAVAVQNGVFSATLDFGSGPFNGSARWLQVQVITNGGNTVVTLEPRQPLTAAPYALYARSADGSGLTNLSASNLTSGTLASSLLPRSGAWSMSGTLDVDGGTLAVDAANNRVGIGTASPGRPLHLVTANTFTARFENSHPAVTVFELRNSSSNSTWELDVGGTSPPFGLLPGSFYIRPTSIAAPLLSISPTGVTTFSTNFPAQMTLLANGRLTVPAMDLRGGNNSTAESNLRLYNFLEQEYIYLGSGALNRGLIGVRDTGTGVLRAGLRWDIGGQGFVFGDVKAFCVENPRQQDTDIVYACIEGPEAAAYVRGTDRLVGGRAVVALPDHFQDVAVEEGLTVQVTPCSADSRGLAVTAQSVGGFEVRELQSGTGSYDFHWRVEAVRRGFEDFQVIRPTSERRVPSQPTGDALDAAPR